MTETLTPSARQQRTRRSIARRAQNKLVRDLITPEGAALKLTLGTAGERAGALIVDIILIIIIATIVLISIVVASARAGFEGGEIASAIAMVFIFFLRNFYFVFFEIGRRAATPGKRMLGLRVAARNGGRLTANAVFARNFIREVEVFLPVSLLLIASGQTGVSGWITLFALVWSGLFMFFPLFNRDKLRAGDIIAGTWVIHAPKVKLETDISGVPKSVTAMKARAGFNFTDSQLGAYGIHELHVLEDVLRQSTPEVKQGVANRIRNKIGWDKAARERDAEFLDAYYAALRRHLEQKLLLGQRKADKFDKG